MLIAPEYQNDPQIVFSHTQFAEGRITWLEQLMTAVMKWAGLTKRVLRPTIMMKEMNITKGSGKWLCARKVTLPGHLSSSLMGQ
jgi:hypothetical protein